MDTAHLKSHLDPLVKSTNVRANAMKANAMEVGFEILGKVSPELASMAALHPMFRVRQFPRPPWEQEFLEGAGLIKTEGLGHRGLPRDRMVIETVAAFMEK